MEIVFALLFYRYSNTVDIINNFIFCIWYITFYGMGLDNGNTFLYSRCYWFNNDHCSCYICFLLY